MVSLNKRLEKIEKDIETIKSLFDNHSPQKQIDTSKFSIKVEYVSLSCEIIAITEKALCVKFFNCDCSIWVPKSVSHVVSNENDDVSILVQKWFWEKEMSQYDELFIN